MVGRWPGSGIIWAAGKAAGGASIVVPGSATEGASRAGAGGKRVAAGATMFGQT